VVNQRCSLRCAHCLLYCNDVVPQSVMLGLHTNRDHCALENVVN
jgi:Pyruvate/2-oxoacid:ferredoxin oxidoreductase delta subunit